MSPDADIVVLHKLMIEGEEKHICRRQTSTSVSTEEHRAAFLARNNGGTVSYRSVVSVLRLCRQAAREGANKGASLLFFSSSSQ